MPETEVPTQLREAIEYSRRLHKEYGQRICRGEYATKAERHAAKTACADAATIVRTLQLKERPS